MHQGLRLLATRSGCPLWAFATFVVVYDYAGSIHLLGGNAIEFVIANHWWDYGRYAMGFSYPTAVWRPVLPTFVVLLIERLTADPVVTFQLVAAISLSSFVASMYVCGRMLGGVLLAHCGAVLAFTCPAITVLLLNHIHSISHLCMLGVLGPTVALSIRSLFLEYSDDGRVRRYLLLSGLFWGLCCLARAELVLSTGVFFSGCGAILFRKKALRTIAIPLSVFCLIYFLHAYWIASAKNNYDLATSTI
jgi:hypothetical protein